MKKILSCGAFLLLLILLLCAAYRVLAWKDTTGGYLSNTQQLYATGDDQIDLVFVGSSHIYCGLNPAVFWNKGGISAFDLSVSGMDKVSSVHYLEELYKTQHPQVVCLDLYDLMFDRQALESNVYRNYLSMKPSLNSIQAVLDYQPDDLPSYLTRWPIVHTRYKELQAFDFVQYPVSQFGRGFYYSFAAAAQTQDPAALATGQVTPLSDQNRAWLDSIIDLCSRQGSTLYTVLIPMIMDAEDQAILNGASQYLQSRGIPCLDLNQHVQEMGLDYNTDFLDFQHLNTNGAQKLTTYLYDILTGLYSFPSHWGDDRYAFWEENSRYDLHQQQVQTLLQRYGNDLNGTLRTLADSSRFTIALSIPPDILSSYADWQDLVPALGVPADQLAQGGQWILRDGQVLAYLTPGCGGSASVDLNDIDTLTITDGTEPTTSLNGIAQGTSSSKLGLTVYDDYEAKVLFHQFYQ